MTETFPELVFLDLELDSGSNHFFEGGTYQGGVRLRHHNLADLVAGIRTARWVVGHNIYAHDWPFLQKKGYAQDLQPVRLIDTLQLSALLMPELPYHKLAKGYMMDEMTISHIVYWRNEDMPARVPVILPRMRMRKP